MDFVYKKVIAFVLSEAAAHSDRIKIAIVGMIMAGFAVIASRCGFCGQFLTPDVALLAWFWCLSIQSETGILRFLTMALFRPLRCLLPLPW